MFREETEVSWENAAAAEIANIEVLLALLERREDLNFFLVSGVSLEQGNDGVNADLTEGTYPTDIYKLDDRCVRKKMVP